MNYKRVISVFVGHKAVDEREQPLLEHLQGTAQLAGNFAAAFGAEGYGYLTGLLHDIGKYSKEAQERILHNGPKVDHSTAGAWICATKWDRLAAYCIAGHHAGLPNGGTRSNTADTATLYGRMHRAKSGQIPNFNAYETEVTFTKPQPPNIQLLKPQGFSISFFIRMLYSCLVDADFLDTEQFMSNGIVERGGYDSIDTLYERLQDYIKNWWDAKSTINQKRCEILKDCINTGKSAKGLYTLTVPTGGGKTISSLAFALNHAKTHGMDRVIYVIPYTSIIEQNAQVFRDILGDHNVLEHHSNVNYDPQDDSINDAALEKKRRAAENWDAPIVVTTNVQFFESLFANRSSRCRKLHAIANSVIIFDEAQMLPLPYLKPCIQAIAELVQNYHSTAVLCTATQPSLHSFFPKEIQSKEICSNPLDLYEFFRRTHFQFAGVLNDDALTKRLNEHKQVLCIVNSRKQAQYIFTSMKEEGSYHLSTLMTPNHRKNVLEQIRERLKKQLPCRVISTSLIEAGVDVDFPVVYRAEAGLDSVIQAAGRCNRENKRPIEKSVVYVFQPEQKYTQHYPYTMQRAIAAQDIVRRSHDDISSLNAIQTYFSTLYTVEGEHALDAKSILDQLNSGISEASFPFADIAQQVRLIEQETYTVIIPKWEKAQELVARLQYGEHSRSLIRQIGPYAVQIYGNQYEDLLQANAIEILDSEIAVLTNLDLYNDATGLTIIREEGVGIFI